MPVFGTQYWRVSVCFMQNIRTVYLCLPKVNDRDELVNFYLVELQLGYEKNRPQHLTYGC